MAIACQLYLIMTMLVLLATQLHERVRVEIARLEPADANAAIAEHVERALGYASTSWLVRRGTGR